MDTYDAIYSQDPRPDGAFGFIQWKGTDVCMDVHCACGNHQHVDNEFVYAVKCDGCGQKYAVGFHVKLIPLTDEQVAEWEADREMIDVEGGL